MSALNQKTLNKSISIKGVGLHSGQKVNMKVLPAQPNTGIIFKRVDLNKNNIVIPSVTNVTNASFCTTISNEQGIKISTIEHLMGSMFCLGIDNAIIEIDNEEVPILDGSAKIFNEMFASVGFETSNTPIKIIKIEKKIEVKKESKYISIDKSNLNLEIDFQLNYKNKLIGNQRNKINIYEDNLKDVYNSRTFCLYEDIQKLRDIGLAQGGSLDNAIVVKNDKILNSGGLRNDLEFVNHKILDCLGDLYLLGYKLIGSIKCVGGGHGLTNQLLREVLSNKSNFSMIEIKEKALPNILVNKTSLKSIA